MMMIQNKQILLFTGDSITDCGRGRPVGSGDNLGTGYVSLVNSLMGAYHPERMVRVFNTGVGGNRVIDLEARWQRDVLDIKPDWLSIMIGINDVWGQFDGEHHQIQVEPELFMSTYRSLLEQTRPTLKGLVLMTPYYIEANMEEPIRKRMDEYGGIVKILANEFDAIFVDVQEAYNEFMVKRPTQSLSGDRVHPNQIGHMLMACAFLKQIGFKWNELGGV